MEERWIGFIAAVGAIFFFGSYAAPIRLPSAVSIDPVVFQAYKSLVCFLTAWPVLLFVRFKFTWWGVVGGAAWVFTGTLAIKAVKLAGIAPTQSIWSGLSIFISYFWGAYVFNENTQSELLSYVSLLIMALGMSGIAFVTSSKRDWIFGTYSALFSRSDAVLEVLIPVPERKQPSSDSQNFKYGVLCAVLVGFVNGSLMVPLKYAHQDVVGIEYLVSFGIGALASALSLLIVYQIVRFLGDEPFLNFHFGREAAPALVAGLLWSAGNFCSIYTTIYLGMSFGWPLVQCQIIVSALWAVFYFREVEEGKQTAGLIISTALVVTGAGLLFRFGTVAA